MAGTTTAEYCAQHAPGRMIDVCRVKCRPENCGKEPSFGVAGTKRRSTVRSTHRTECQRQEKKVQNPRLRKGAVVWSGRYKNGGVLCTARTGRNGRRLQDKVQNRKLRQGTVVRSCRYKKKGVLCAARTERDGRRREQKVQNPRLRKGAVVWSGRYNTGGVLCTARQTTIRCQKVQGQRGWPTPLLERKHW